MGVINKSHHVFRNVVVYRATEKPCTEIDLRFLHQRRRS